MVTITEAEAQAWLERQADHFTETGQFTSDIPLGVSQLTSAVIFSEDDIRGRGIYERFDPGPVTFWCYWHGKMLTTTRNRGARPAG